MAKSRASGKVVAISEGEYLARKGLASNFSDVGIDTMRIPHGETLRQQQKRLRDQKRQRDEYFAKREQAKAEYANLVSSGKIKAPSKYDSLISLTSLTLRVRRQCDIL